jgi:hypothetical protein
VAVFWWPLRGEVHPAESPRTAKLDDRRQDESSLDEVERIVI